VKSGSLGLRGTMIAWTVSIIGIMVLQGKMAADMVSNPEMQKLIQEAQQQAQQPAAAPAPAPAPAPANQ
jgi:shikimate 5-dehydrogenase